MRCLVRDIISRIQIYVGGERFIIHIRPPAHLDKSAWAFKGCIYTLVNVYVDLVVFTSIAGTS